MPNHTWAILSLPEIHCLSTYVFRPCIRHDHTSLSRQLAPNFSLTQAAKQHSNSPWILALCNCKWSTQRFWCNNVLQQLNRPGRTQIRRTLDHCGFHQHRLYQSRHYWFCSTSDCLLLKKNGSPPRCMVLPPAAAVTSQDQNGNHCCSVLHAALSSADPILRMQCLVMLSDRKKKKKLYRYIFTIWKTTEDKICLFTYFHTMPEHPFKDLIEGFDVFFINWRHFWRLFKSKFINSMSTLTAYKHLNKWAATTLQTTLKDINLNRVCTDFSRNISLMSWNRHLSKTVLTNLMNSISNNDIKL